MTAVTTASYEPHAQTKVLLAEDEESFVDALVVGLAREGFDVTARHIAESFKDLLRRREADRGLLGDLEALEGVSRFPARVKCATLVMNAFEQAIDRIEKGGATSEPEA